MRLQPYRQISVGGRRPEKLSPLFYGPYRALQRVGTVAYKLELPEEAKLHPVFHVSQLKKKLGEAAQVQHQVPSHYVEQILVPELMLERRMMNMKGKAVTEVMIKWKNLSVEEASWERYWELVKRFPNFDLEARSNLGGGIDAVSNSRVATVGS